jgi:hypothetical protein
MSLKTLFYAVVLSGVLAAADPGCLERVQARRVANGWGLTDVAPAGVVLIALEDCERLGDYALMFVAGERQPRRVRVVDCQQKGHKPLHELGLVADVSEQGLNHKRARIVLR